MDKHNSQLGKEVDKNIEAKQQRSAAINQVKSQVIANLRHDVHNPLNGIIGLANILQQESKTEKDREYATLIFSSANKLHNLLDDILEVIEPERLSEKSLKIETVNVRELVAEILQLLASDARAKDLPIELDLSSSVPHTIMTDRAKIKRILLTVLENAIQYTKMGHVSLIITHEMIGSDISLMRFIITDTGIGIAENDLAHIFDLFYRANRINQVNDGHYGIGLFLARKYTEVLNGKINFASQVSKGTQVSIEIPVKIA